MHSTFRNTKWLLFFLLLPHALFAGPFSTVRFTLLNEQDGGAFLGTSDAVIEQLGELDFRLIHGKVVTKEEHLAFLSRQAVAWTDEETAAMEATLAKMKDALSSLGIDPQTPDEIVFIKGSGKELPVGGYTRRNGVLLMKPTLELPKDFFEQVVYHEVFHVLSRHNPQWRDGIYSVFGFRRFAPFDLPPGVRAAMITNPDAITFEHGITVGVGTRELDVVPLFQLGKATGPPTLASAIGVRLLRVDAAGVVKNRGGAPVLLNPEATDYQKRIGENTRYYPHPEEVTATHFQWMVHKAAGGEPIRLPRPEKLDELCSALLSSQASA